MRKIRSLMSPVSITARLERLYAQEVEAALVNDVELCAGCDHPREDHLGVQPGPDGPLWNEECRDGCSCTEFTHG